MKFTRSGGQTAVGPKEWFTCTVYIDGVRNPDEQSAIGYAQVRFAPDARTARHEIREIRPGDVVNIESNEQHSRCLRRNDWADQTGGAHNPRRRGRDVRTGGARMKSMTCRDVFGNHHSDDVAGASSPAGLARGTARIVGAGA
jgi:hypothetical protein